jgi:hypothetical protein
MKSVFSTVTFLLMTSVALADTITVCLDGSCDYTSIQEAVNAADDGDVIQLASETYNEGAAINIGSKDLVIRGMINKSGFPTSVIDGADLHRVISCNAFEPSTINLENLIIQNGNANYAAGVSTFVGVTALIRNCWFLGNNGLDSIGGALANAGAMEIINCRFQGNQAENGGAVDNQGSMTVRDCVFTANFASASYGALSLFAPGVVEDCLFLGNIAGSGGAMGAATGSVVRNCTFDSNIASDPSEGGGAVFCNSDSPTLISCTFVDNSAANGGAVLNYFSSSPTIQDCVFQSNSSTGHGGAIVNSTNSSPSIDSSIFRRNVSGLSGAAISSVDPTCIPGIQGSLFCENAPADISGSWNDEGGNLFNSVCSCPDSDMDGICDDEDQCPGVPDVDSDEDGVADCLDGCPTDPNKTDPGRCGCGVVDTAVRGDFNCDGVYDHADFLAMQADLGICPGDLTGDGQVDGQDLGLLFVAWGICP